MFELLKLISNSLSEILRVNSNNDSRLVLIKLYCSLTDFSWINIGTAIIFKLLGCKAP